MFSWRYEDEESSYGGRYRGLLFWRDELRSRCPKHVIGTDYDERPLVKGTLFVADDEPEIWIPISDLGHKYA